MLGLLAAAALAAPSAPPLSPEVPPESWGGPAVRWVEAAPAPPPEEPPAGSPLVAAAWCPLADRGDEAAAAPAVACDAGVGLALYPWAVGRGRTVSLVAALGAATVGAGVALTVGSTERLRVSVAAGVAAPYDGDGVYVDEMEPVVGATLGWLPRVGG